MDPKFEVLKVNKANVCKLGPVYMERPIIVHGNEGKQICIRKYFYLQTVTKIKWSKNNVCVLKLI